mgnify:CR=1 FL=1
MEFKFSPGDEIVLVNPRASGWTCRYGLSKGLKGTVVSSVEENDESIFVKCCFPGVFDGWWVHEDEIDFVEQPFEVDVSNLL